MKIIGTRKEVDVILNALGEYNCEECLLYGLYDQEAKGCPAYAPIDEDGEPDCWTCAERFLGVTIEEG